MTADAYELAWSRLRSIAGPRGSVSFEIAVPPGRYLIFLAPSDPGAPAIYGAYTRYSLCARDDPQANCADHELIPVTVATRAQRVAVSVDAWYLSDEVMERIDLIRGVTATEANEPLRLPRFSEYRVAQEPTAATVPISANIKLPAEDRVDLRSVAAAGPNFAGHLSLVIAHCGDECSRVLIIDWRNGSLTESTAIGVLRGALPCRRTEVLAFRRDSRLLNVTTTDGDDVLTRYFVLGSDGATPVYQAEYRRAAGAFCAPAAP